MSITAEFSKKTQGILGVNLLWDHCLFVEEVEVWAASYNVNLHCDFFKKILKVQEFTTLSTPDTMGHCNYQSPQQYCISRKYCSKNHPNG
jgi:hypothetical protein